MDKNTRTTDFNCYRDLRLRPERELRQTKLPTHLSLTESFSDALSVVRVSIQTVATLYIYLTVISRTKPYTCLPTSCKDLDTLSAILDAVSSPLQWQLLKIPELVHLIRGSQFKDDCNSCEQNSLGYDDEATTAYRAVDGCKVLNAAVYRPLCYCTTCVL